MLLKKLLFLFLSLSYLPVSSQVELQKFYNSQNGLTSEHVTQITQDYIGYLWIGTTEGLFKFDGNDFVKINNEKITFLTSKGQKIYIGTDKGLLIKQLNWEEFYESKSIKGILFYKNKILLATALGVSELKNDYIQPLQLSTTIDFSIINDLVFFEKYFYLATNKGLYKVDNINSPKEIIRIDNDNCVDLEIFDKKIIAGTFNNGLKIIENNNINTINSTKKITSINKFKNQLWINSEIDAIEIYALPSFTFIKKINKYNTITTNHVLTDFQDNTNNIWIGTNKGLFQFSSNSNKEVHPKVNFESFEVNYEDKSDLLNSNKIINLDPSQNSIVLHYRTVNLNKPNSIEYKYKLNDFTSKWMKNNSLQLVNLNYGDYDLEIQSKINDVISDSKKLNFVITTPFYYNVYFIITSFVVFIFILYLSVNQHIKRIHKKNNLKLAQLKTENTLLSLKQKSLQLQMNPHFIFNVLNNIKALGNSGKINDLNKSISQFSNLLRSLLHNSTKEEISLKDELISIENYLSLEKLICNKSFNYDIKVNIAQIDTEEVLIPTMLFQPFIENSIKHGFSVNKKNLVKVIVNIKNNFLHIKIVDNGIGFNSSKEKNSSSGNSLALKITKERLDKITRYNNFEINEVVKKNVVIGTRVSFKIPLVLDY